MRPLQIYLVEDSPVIRDSLIATLEELAPVQVIGCAAGESDASHWLRHSGEPVDLVIVDIFLKSGSGLGVLGVAQALARRPHLAVLSNYARPEMRRACLALGAERVFDKSTEIDALVQYCADLAASDEPLCTAAAAPA